MAENLLSLVRTFRGGIHPPDEKDTTCDIPIQDFMDPEEDLVFLMQQHLFQQQEQFVSSCYLECLEYQRCKHSSL